jgi:hypothetical protein
MRRRSLIRGVVSIGAVSLAACAAQAAPVPRRWKIGGLFAGFTRDGNAQPRDALARIGYIDGLNLRMAKSLGPTVPDVVLHQATDVER